MNRTILLSAALGALALLSPRFASAQIAPSPEPGDVPSLPPEEKKAEPPPPVESPAPAPAPALRGAQASYPMSEAAGEPEWPPRNDLVRIDFGPRIGYIATRGFDTFAKSDVLAQLSLSATYPVLSSGKFVLGAGLAWDFGGRSDKLRGLDTSLTAHRFSVPIEARYAVLPGLSPFVKVSPGALAAFASVSDGTGAKDLSATGWAFSADASIGASILLGPRKRLDRRMARFWLTPEVGYAYATAAKLSVARERDESQVLGSDERTSLRSLALSGFFWRATVGVSF